MRGASVRVETAIEIERPPQSVFDYVTTPALWHTWHPATARWLHREERGSASLAPRTRGEGRGEGPHFVTRLSLLLSPSAGLLRLAVARRDT
jgi:uncharacterized protein YndB with AHSA1/START domain